MLRGVNKSYWLFKYKRFPISTHLERHFSHPSRTVWILANKKHQWVIWWLQDESREQKSHRNQFSLFKSSSEQQTWSCFWLQLHSHQIYVFENSLCWPNKIYSIWSRNKEPHIIYHKLIKFILHGHNLTFIRKSLLDIFWFHRRGKTNVVNHLKAIEMILSSCGYSIIYIPNKVRHYWYFLILLEGCFKLSTLGVNSNSLISHCSAAHLSHVLSKTLKNHQLILHNHLFLQN